MVTDPVREVPGIVLTAFELCQRGATCFVLPFPDGMSEIFALAPDFVLLPAICPYPFLLTLRFVAAGIQFGFAQAKADSDSSMQEFMSTASGDLSLTRTAGCVCCWGSRTADPFKQGEVFSREQVKVTGYPGFDYYVAPLSEVCKMKGSTGIAASGPTVLVDSGFSRPHSFYKPKALAVGSIVRDTGFAEQDEAEGRNEPSSLNVMAALADQLAEDFPTVNIVLSVDRHELSDDHERKLSERPNLLVTSVAETPWWILRSAAVVQKGCSSAIAASLAHIPALSPQWVPSLGSDSVAEAVSVQCSDYAQLRSVLNAVLAGNYKESQARRKKKASLIEEVFYKADGLAHKRVAAAIIESMRPEVSPNLTKCRHYLSQLPVPASFQSTDTRSRAGYLQDLAPVPPEDPDDSLSEKVIKSLVAVISKAKRADQPKKVSTYSANAGGVYFNYQYRGNAVVMTCS